MNNRRFLWILFFFISFPLLETRGEDEAEPLLAVSEIRVADDDSPLGNAREMLKNGRVKKARRATNQFLKTNKESAEGWTLLGQTYLATGANRKAKKKFKKALKYDPHYAPAYMGWGEIFESESRWDEAANEYRAARIADPNNPAAEIALERLAARTASTK
jgi:tetratricopeptide (TPR) repeat protein